MYKILLFISLCTANLATAQTELFQIFGRRYTPLHFPRMVPTAENNQFWVAGELPSGGEHDIFWGKLDSAGVLAQADTLGALATEHHVVDLASDAATGGLWLLTLRETFVADGSPKMLMINKFDEGGQLLFEQAVLPAERGCVRALPDGGAAVVAIDDSSYQLLRLDANGALHWQKTMDGGASVGGFDVLATTADSTLVLAKRDTNGAVVLRAFGAADGSDYWQHTLQPADGTPTRQVAVAFDPTDSTVVVFHEALLSTAWRYVFTKINAQGAVVWQSSMFSRSYTHGAGRRLTVDTTARALLLLGPGGLLRCALDSGAVVADYDFSMLFSSGPWTVELGDGFFTDSLHWAAVGRDGSTARFLRFSVADTTFAIGSSFSQLRGEQAAEGSAVMATDTLGNFFVANALDFEAPTNHDVVLRKFDPSGGLLFQKTGFAPADQYPGDLLQLSDGQLLMLATTTGWQAENRRLVLQKISPLNGSVLWEKQHPQPLSLPYGLRAVAMPDGGAVVVFTREFQAPSGETLPYQTCAIRFSAQGDTVWAARFLPDASAVAAQSKKRRFTDLEWMPDGSLLAIGEVEMAHGFGLHFSALNGQQIAAFEVNPGIFQDARLNTVLPISMTEAIVHANPRRIMRISTVTGQVLHFEFLYFNNGASQSAHLFRTPDGRAMGLFGNIPYHPGSYGFRVVEIQESDLSLLSNTELRTENLLMTDAVLLPDCRLAAVGPMGYNNENDLFLVKTAPVCTPVGEDEAASTLAFIEVWPNPLLATVPLHISLGGSFFGKIRLESFSLNGQRLGFLEVEKTAREQVFEWKKLPDSGPFFLRVSDGKNAVTRLVLRV